MSQELEVKVLEALKTVVEPKLKWSIFSLNLVKHIAIQQDRLTLEIHLVTQDGHQIAAFRQQCLELIAPFNFKSVDLQLKRVHIATEGLTGVKHVILVGSGKGGVGKSMVAVNLASTLAQQGLKVGLMDADIYGPSVPTMLGIHLKPEVLGDEYLMPVKAHNIQVMSMGILIPPGKSVAWRGQLVSGTIVQFIQQTAWNEMDFLIVDLPPGTGDVQLTLAQKIRAKGTIIVTTPQEVVLGDVRRMIDLYQEKQTPLLALVENMSGMVCEKCGHENMPFVPSSVGIGVEAGCYLRLPLHKELSQAGDSGIPFVKYMPEHPITKSFQELAKHLVNTVQ